MQCTDTAMWRQKQGSNCIQVAAAVPSPCAVLLLAVQAMMFIAENIIYILS